MVNKIIEDAEKTDEYKLGKAMGKTEAYLDKFEITNHWLSIVFEIVFMAVSIGFCVWTTKAFFAGWTEEVIDMAKQITLFVSYSISLLAAVFHVVWFIKAIKDYNNYFKKIEERENEN